MAARSAPLAAIQEGDLPINKATPNSQTTSTPAHPYTPLKKVNKKQTKKASKTKKKTKVTNTNLPPSTPRPYKHQYNTLRSALSSDKDTPISKKGPSIKQKKKKQKRVSPLTKIALTRSSILEDVLSNKEIVPLANQL